MSKSHDRTGLFANREPRTGGHALGGFRMSLRRIIPAGPALDTIFEWIEEGLDVGLFRQGGSWHIRVGNRELTVDEYLLLFDEREGK